MKSPITAITIINPNWFDATEILPQALNSVMWCEERVIATSAVTKDLKLISQKYNAKIFLQSGENFSTWRYAASQKATQDWILFIDADEEVTADLKQEICQLIQQSTYSAYAIPRLNYILGRAMRHGGWWPDYVIRLIIKAHLLGYEGEVHEQPKISGEIGYTKNYFNHFKHRYLDDMVAKTQVWSSTESKLLHDSGHPPMKSYRFIRPFITEIWSRLILKQGFLDGEEGWIDSFYQGFSRLITYTKLWELQQPKY